MSNKWVSSFWMAAVSLIAISSAGLSIYAAFYSMGTRGAQDVIAFVDFPTILRESEAGKTLNAQLIPKQEALQKDAQAKLKEFQQQQDEIKKHADTLSSKELDDKQKALQAKIDAWNVQAQKREAAINNAANAAIQTINQTLRGQLAVLAQENNVTAVLPAEQAFFAQKKLDITPEATRRLDQQLPKVDLKFEEEK